MPILITDAEPDHLPVLSSLAKRSKAHWGYDDSFMTACADELTYSGDDLAANIVRIAAMGDGVAGFHILSIEGGEEEGNSGEIEAFFVDPDHMGKGVGKALFDDLLAFAEKRGVRKLICQSDPFAEPFYLAMGMARVGESESASIKGRMVPLLEMILT